MSDTKSPGTKSPNTKSSEIKSRAREAAQEMGREMAHESDGVELAGNRIRSFVERIEQLETELAELNEQKKEVFGEAKGEGYDVKVLREIIKLRKQDEAERDEHDMLLDTYMRAMEEAPAEAA